MFILLSFVVCSANAQRFFYIETSSLVDQLLKSRLEKSDQYVVPSAMESEYTVRTKVQRADNSKELSLEIILADSVTQKEVYRSYEQFCFTTGDGEPQLLYSVAVRSFLQRRIGEMMLSAKRDHTGLFQQELKARKDKT